MAGAKKKKSLLGKIIKIKAKPNKKENVSFPDFSDWQKLESEILTSKEGGQWQSLPEEGQLSVDIYQDRENIIVLATVAGAQAQDLEITLAHDLLTIRGTRQPPEPVAWQDYYYQECFWGPFSRSLILPQEVKAENASATLKNGILKIILPKSHRPKTSKVKVQEIPEV